MNNLNAIKGNPNDGNAYEWRFGNYLTGPKIGANGSRFTIYQGFSN
jgi:hypothetical protein